MAAENVEGIFILCQVINLIPVTPFQLNIKPGVINLSVFQKKKERIFAVITILVKNTFHDANMRME